MRSSGVIKKIEENKVTVSIYKDSACSHCSKCSEQNKISNDYTFISDRELEVGDIITFEMEDGKVLKAAMIVYLIPVVAMILGYYLSSKMGLSEGMSVGISFLGMVLSFLGIYIYDKKVVKNKMEENVEIIFVQKGNENEI